MNFIARSNRDPKNQTANEIAGVLCAYSHLQ